MEIKTEQGGLKHEISNNKENLEFQSNLKWMLSDEIRNEIKHEVKKASDIVNNVLVKTFNNFATIETAEDIVKNIARKVKHDPPIQIGEDYSSI